jgi:TatA/E family protein of Tat protein translocase
MLGTPEIIALIAAIVFLMWGPDKIKEFARSFGEAQSEYKEGKKGLEEASDDIEEAVDED